MTVPIWFTIVASFKNDQIDIVETVIILASFMIMMTWLIPEFYGKVVAILLYVIASCFYYNMLSFHYPHNLSILVSHIVLGFVALDANIEDHVTK